MSTGNVSQDLPKVWNAGRAATLHNLFRSFTWNKIQNGRCLMKTIVYVRLFEGLNHKSKGKKKNKQKTSFEIDLPRCQGRQFWAEWSGPQWSGQWNPALAWQTRPPWWCTWWPARWTCPTGQDPTGSGGLNWSSRKWIEDQVFGSNETCCFSVVITAY